VWHTPARQDQRTSWTGWPGRYSSASISATGHGLRATGHPDDLVSRLDRALAQHPEVKAGPVMRDQQRRDPGVVHPDANPEAGHPRLRHLQERLPDPVPIADADLVVGQPAYSEVLTELAELKVVPP
jgi:hypothetical protein